MIKDRIDRMIGRSPQVREVPPRAFAEAVAARSPKPKLNGDHLMTVRRAVAHSYQSDGMPLAAERTLAGDADDFPRMKAGIAAAEAILRGMFA
jgi:hypothetical protein